jgi:hypothetical protein
MIDHRTHRPNPNPIFEPHRIIAVPAVPGLFSLDPPADVIDGGEPEPHDMEGVEYPHGMRQRDAQRGCVAAVGVQHRHPDPGPPPRVALVHPTHQRRPASIFDHVEQPRRPNTAAEVDDAGHETRRSDGRGGLKRRLVQPDHLDPVEAAWVIDPRRAVLTDRGHRGTPADPELAGHRGDRGPSSPTRRQISARARPVNEARGAISGQVCVQVRFAHNLYGHRQTHLIHTSVTGRPPAGRSRTQHGRRSCNSATAPHCGQPTKSAVVSTACSHSPS